MIKPSTTNTTVVAGFFEKVRKHWVFDEGTAVGKDGVDDIAGVTVHNHLYWKL